MDAEQVVGQWRLGEDDPGAVAGNAGNGSTRDSVGTRALTRYGNPAYSSDTPGSGSALSMQFHGNTTANEAYQISGSGLWDGFDLTNYHLSCDVKYFGNNGAGFSFPLSMGRNISGGGSISILQNGNPGNWTIHFGGTTASAGTVSVVANTWTHLDLWRTNGYINLYVNGVLTKSRTTAPSTIASFFTVGGNQNGTTNAGAIDGRFDGLVDNVALVDLSASVGTPPGIASLGASPGTMLTVGDTLTLTAGGVSGTAPLGFTWRKNTIAFTNTGFSGSVAIVGVTTNDSGNYTVLVTNAYGASTSPVVSISVFSPVVSTGAVVTLNSLLREMADPDSLARFPAPAYKQKQGSTYNRASYARDQPNQDTSGWFADSDGTYYIRKETNALTGGGEYVLVDYTGPGAITKLWTPFFYYSFSNRTGVRIRIYLDGFPTPIINENLIELVTRLEWSTNDYGAKPASQNDFTVPSPISAFTARAGDCYLPIPFASSCKVTVDAAPFYDIISYRAYAPGTTVEPFSMAAYNAAFNQTQMALTAQQIGSPTNFAGGQFFMTNASLAPNAGLSLMLNPGSAAVRHLEFQLDPAQIAAHPDALRSTVLLMSFDGEQTVWCPLGDFFCSANQLHPLETWTRSVTTNDARMICRWVMPYQTSASVTLTNLGTQAVTAQLAVRTGSWAWDSRSMHFRANWRSDYISQGSHFMDWNFIDAQGQGVLVGDAWTVLNRTSGWWGEGDEKIYTDGEYDTNKFPAIFGTGTEDYYGWAGGVNPTKTDEFFTPYLANVLVGSTSANSPLGFNVNTRIRALDAIPFNQRLVFDMEASPGTGQRNDWDLLMYSGVTFWYAEPGATSNRGAQSAAAAQTITSLDDLNRLSDLLRNGGANFIPGAIEAESLTPTLQQGVDAVAQTPDAALHPELVLSGGRQLYVPFTGPGQFVELELAQQFQAQLLRAYLTQLTNYGTVRIWVNGRLVADNVNLNASALSVVAVNLGLHAPTDNRFVIRIESLPAVAGTNYAAGVDAFVCGSVPPIVNSEWAWNLGEQDAGAVSGGATASATVEANDGYNVAYNLSKFGTTYYTNDVPSGTGSTLAISLSGAGAFTNLNCAAIANLDQNNFSIAFDAKPQKGTSTYATALCLSRYGRYSPFIYVDNKNATGAQTKWIYAVNGQAEAQITGYGPGTNKWQHVEFVRLAGTNYLYINGALAGATVTTFAGTFLPCFSVGVPVNSSTAFDTGGYFTGSLDNVVLGPPATSFSQFIAGVFPNQSDPAIIAPSSDPDHDGMANVFEFLYGTNPANASSRSVIGTASLVKIGGTNRLQYSLPMDPVSRNQLLWAVMISTDLVNWQYIADQATYSGPTNQPVVIVDPANASDFPRRFMRLVIPQ